MDLKEAERQKVFIAEKQISYVRMIVIAFGTGTFFFLNNNFIHTKLAHLLLVIIWLYGLYIPIFKPYKKYPIFLASWFTYISDSIFATLWIYATGGFYSPYHAMFYTSIIAVSFRFNLKTTLFTASLYSLCYFALLFYLEQLAGNEALSAVRTGFIFIIGFMTHLITQETLLQTQQKVTMQRLAGEASENYEKLQKSQAELNELNLRLQLRNNIFNHAEENSLIGSYAFHLEENKLEYSDNLFRILGYAPNEFEPSFEKYMTFLNADDKNKLLSEWEESRRTKTFKMNVQRIKDKNGKLKYFKSSGRFIGAGTETMLIGTLQDITNDVILNETLKEKNQELEKSNNELASFNYIASHDLQEPVRKIHAFSRLILEKTENELSESNKNYLSRISSAAVRMQNLIEAFLNYSRIDNAKLEFEKTDLNKILNESIAQLSDLIEEKNVKIEKENLPELSVIPFQVQQLFINLISNSIKYQKPEVQPEIKINCEKISGKLIESPDAISTNIYWKITIEDNGIGFDQKYVNKIFEVFKRLHSKEEYAGTGIGLSICKKIMTSHNGIITASGVVGKGAVFNCYFPAR